MVKLFFSTNRITYPMLRPYYILGIRLFLTKILLLIILQKFNVMLKILFYLMTKRNESSFLLLPNVLHSMLFLKFINLLLLSVRFFLMSALLLINLLVFYPSLSLTWHVITFILTKTLMILWTNLNLFLPQITLCFLLLVSYY